MLFRRNNSEFTGEKTNNPSSLVRSWFTVYAFRRTTFIELVVYFEVRPLRPPDKKTALTEYNIGLIHQKVQQKPTTKVGKIFLTIIKETFSSNSNTLSKIFNKNTVKISTDARVICNQGFINHISIFTKSQTIEEYWGYESMQL